MNYRVLAWIGVLAVLSPAGVGATSVNVPLTHGGGPYLVGFEVETMVDKVDGQEIESLRYLARISWKAFDNVGLSVRLGGSEISVPSDVYGVPLTFDGQPKFAFGLGATYLHPVREDFLTLFADGQLLYTLSNGPTSFESTELTPGSSSFAEDYVDRYSWDEYQAGFGVQVEIPWAKLYSGAIIRGIQGSVSGRTLAANGDITDWKNSFSKEPSAYALFGADIPMPGRLTFSVNAQARSGSEYGWTISLSEFSR